ncbi:MAG: hypothetical protein RML12_02980 [Xanthomonadales bacterium]|nr:hypothetical protein [Xanthomonadales bacterium]
MSALALARLGLARELRGDGLLPLLAALALGVAAMGAVRLLAQRIDAAFVADGAAWLGGDLGVAGRTPVAPAWLDEARRRGLAATRIVQFPTVLFHGERSVLAEVKAVDEAYPLRGRLSLAGGVAAAPARAPPPGTAYAEARLLEALGLAPGDRIELGGRALAIGGVLVAEPDLGGELFQLAPRLLVRLEDLAGSGLLGPGSRAAWRLLVAGDGEVRSGGSASGWSRGSRSTACSAPRTSSASPARPSTARAASSASRPCSRC